MEKGHRIFGIFLSGLMILGLFAPITVFAADPSVLLVWDSSTFKDELANEVQQAAEDEGLVIDVEDSIKFLKNIDPTEYTGIIIINTGMAGRMKGKVRTFLESSPELPPTVVVTTFGDPAKSKDSENPRPAVDALTTASLSDAEEIRELARKVVNSLKRRLIIEIAAEPDGTEVHRTGDGYSLGNRKNQNYSRSQSTITFRLSESDALSIA